MTTTKKLGIWMDHSSAHLIEFTAEPQDIIVLHSKFTHQAKELSLGKSESGMHVKEQHQQTEYYKQLGDVIKKYAAVLLFGPTDAKTELYNTLKDDHLFNSVKIDVQQADKMTENQQHAFVKKHFSAKVPAFGN